jgi:hypothetical protein
MQLEWLTLEEYQLTYGGTFAVVKQTNHSYIARLFPSIALCLILSAYKEIHMHRVCEARGRGSDLFTSFRWCRGRFFDLLVCVDIVMNNERERKMLAQLVHF